MFIVVLLQLASHAKVVLYIKEERARASIKKKAFLEIVSKHRNSIQIFTDGSKEDGNVVSAAVSCVAPNCPFLCRLRDYCSMFKADLQAMLFALRQAYQSQERIFQIN